MRWIVGILALVIAFLAWSAYGLLPGPVPQDLPAEDPRGDEAQTAEEAPGLAGQEGEKPDAGAGLESGDGGVPFVDAGGVQLIGRAVDERRRPVAGAAVAAAMEGVPSGRAVTGPDGRFSVSLGEAGLYARMGWLRLHTSGLAAERQIYLNPDTHPPLDYGTIVLKQARAVVVRVTREGAPAAGALVSLRALDRTGGAARHQASGSDGRATFRGVQADKVAVYAWAEGSGRTQAEVLLEGRKEIELALAPDRVVTVHVVRAGSEEAVAGAEVRIWGELNNPPPFGEGVLPLLPEIRTDASGTAVISGMHSGWLNFVVRAPGLAMRNEGTRVARASLKPGEDELTIGLEPYRTVRFPVAEGSPAPADGTDLSVRRYQPLPGYDVGEVSGKMEGGQVVLSNFPPGFDWGHVESPEGLWAEWRTPVDKDEGEPVTFLRVYDLRVKVVWPDGSPAVGEYIWVNLQPRGRTEHIQSDEAGMVVFPRCVAKGGHVMWSFDDSGHGLSLGTVSLERDPGVVTYTLQPKVSYEVAVRVDGEARLPGEYTLLVESRGPRARPDHPWQVSGTGIEEDPEMGLLRFSWPRKEDGGLSEVFLRAPGYPQVSKVPTAVGDAGGRVQLDLSGATKLKLVVLRPEDGRYHIQLDRWEGEQGDWFTPLNDPGMQTGVRGLEGVHRYEGLAPGRYRVREFYTDLHSEPFELSSEGGERTIEFDVRASKLVKGRVTVPQGERVEFTTVRVEGRDRSRASQMNPARVDEEGTFELRGLEGQKLALIAEHPLLEMAAPMVHVVGDPAPTIALRAGARVDFRIAGLKETTKSNGPSTSPAYSSPISVRMAPSSAWNAEVRPEVAIARDGLFQVALRGDTSVPWTIEIIQRERVPLLFKDVDVDGGVTDLGTLTMSEGATLTARLIKGKEALPQWLAVVATPVGSKTQVASSWQVEKTEPPEIRVRGLGAGRFTITVRKMMTEEPPILVTEVECDGSSPIVIDVKLP